ncbi:MAG: OmpA family protein [Pseudomonadota bacterium]|jgi:chemotaxis protein MotB|nr:OmpA family protein [Pseudomonadota bacterium]
MRAQAKQSRKEEEEESAFVSMTDMTVGFLFIMMILLAFFASQVRETDTVPVSLYDQVVKKRDELLAQVATLQAENKSLKDLVEERDAMIADLSAQIKNLREQEVDLRKQIEDLRKQIEELQKVDPLEAYLASVSIARREVLTRLRDAILLDFPDLEVELSEESDALRFQGEGLFASGSAFLSRDKVAIVSKLAERLNEILPCYTLGEDSRFDESCNPAFALIEAVQIEGHTDNVGSDFLNRTLSAERANSTFFAMTRAAEGVMQHLNLRGQPVLSVAAYGPDRPVTTNETTEGKATNRRIDLRFIMVTPQDTNGIQIIREALQSIGDQP